MNLDITTFNYIIAFVIGGAILGALAGYGFGYRDAARDFVGMDEEEDDDVLDSEELV